MEKFGEYSQFDRLLILEHLTFQLILTPPIKRSRSSQHSSLSTDDITTLSFSETIDDARITSVLETLSDSIQRLLLQLVDLLLKLLRFLQHIDQKIHALWIDDETGEAFGTEVNLINDGSEVLSVFINTVEESIIYLHNRQHDYTYWNLW